MPTPETLSEGVTRLFAAVAAREPSPEERDRITTAISDLDLDRPGVTPTWTLELLEHIASQQSTSTWVRFEPRGLDDSDTFTFLREELPLLVAMDLEDREESWVLRFPSLGMAATITFEGYSYLVERLEAPR